MSATQKNCVVFYNNSNNNKTVCCGCSIPPVPAGKTAAQTAKKTGLTKSIPAKKA